MGRLIDGKWTDSDESYRQGGAFVRATPAFRSFITADSSSPFPPEAGRYHLYVAQPCPWCHRTMIFHALKRLQGVVSISMVDPLMLEGGWRFKVPLINIHGSLKADRHGGTPSATGIFGATQRPMAGRPITGYQNSAEALGNSIMQRVNIIITLFFRRSLI